MSLLNTHLSGGGLKLLGPSFPLSVTMVLVLVAADVSLCSSDMRN